jgi:hypothetical protein
MPTPSSSSVTHEARSSSCPEGRRVPGEPGEGSKGVTDAQRKVIVGCVGALVVWFGMCAWPVGANAQGTAVSKPVAVPVRIVGGQGTIQGARPTVEVRVGNSAAVPVILDTGSSGLRIFATAVRTGPKSGVSVSTTPSNITYAGGHRFTGVVATSVITIGSQRTAKPVQFGLVQNAFCIPRKPKCPAAQGMAGFEKSGGFGILGIGTQSSGGGIVSPLFGMPGSLSNSWSLHMKALSGQLTLGALTPPASTVAATLPMKQIGTSGGHPLWADSRLSLCLTIGTAQGCAPTLLDSGTYSMQLYGQPFAQVPTIGLTVKGGIAVSVNAAGAPHPFWQFSTGTVKSEDLVTLRGVTRSFINTGVQAFFDFTVTHNDLQGTVLLVPSV